MAVIVICIVFIAIIALLNTTMLFFREKSAYEKPDLARLMAREAGPKYIERGNRKAILFIHGFPSSPSTYWKFCEKAAESGYDAFAPLLPGCGTRPEDLRGTNFSQYLASSRDFYLSRRKRYDKFFILGTSMGGSIALALAEEFCADSELAPNALVSICAPITLNSLLRFGIVQNPLIYLARTMGWLFPSFGAGIPDQETLSEDCDETWKGYLGVYPPQTYSLAMGLKPILRDLGKISCPIYIFHARRDRIVDYRNSFIIARKVGSKLIKHYTANMDFFSHNRHNLLFFLSQKERVWAEALKFFDETGEYGGKTHGHAEDILALL